jgi:hypothetical protein
MDHGLALVNVDLEKALQAYRKAVEHHLVSFGKGPHPRACRNRLTTCYLCIAQIERKRGRLPESIAASRERLKLWPGNPNCLFDVACDVALCLPLAAEQAERSRYSNEVLDLLRQAVAAGFKDLDRLQKASALDPVRTRPEFENLTRQIKEKTAN